MDDYDYNDFDEFVDFQKSKRAQKFRRFVGVLVLTVGSAITGAGIYSKGKNEKYSDEKYTQDMQKNVFGSPYTYIRPSEPIVVMIDESIPHEYRKGIEAAIDRLNEVCEGLRFNLVTGDIEGKESIIIKEMDDKFKWKMKNLYGISNDETIGGMAETKSEMFTGLVFRGSKIHLNPNYYEGIYTITIHEILHVLGLAHVQNRKSIMKSIYSFAEPDITKEDIDIINYMYPARNKEKEISKTR